MRVCHIESGSVLTGESPQSGGDGAYDLHGVAGTPGEVGRAIGESLASLDMSRGRDWSYLENGHPLYLHLVVRVEKTPGREPAPAPTAEPAWRKGGPRDEYSAFDRLPAVETPPRPSPNKCRTVHDLVRCHLGDKFARDWMYQFRADSECGMEALDVLTSARELLARMSTLQADENVGRAVVRHLRAVCVG